MIRKLLRAKSGLILRVEMKVIFDFKTPADTPTMASASPSHQETS